MGYKSTPYALYEQRVFQKNPQLTKVQIKGRRGEQDDVPFANIVAMNPKTETVVVQLIDPDRHFVDYKSGDLALAKKRDPRQYPWVIRKVASIPKGKDWISR